MLDALSAAEKAAVLDELLAARPSVTGRPQAANLALSRGRSSAWYVITAPDPARYPFDVSVTAPASIDVAVSIHTWYGAASLSVKLV